MNKDKWAGLDLKKGDRVRIVIEDEVTALWPAGGLDTLCNNFHALDSHIVSIEKLKPALPTEPGTTFRARVTFQDGWGVKPYESTLFVRADVNDEANRDWLSVDMGFPLGIGWGLITPMFTELAWRGNAQTGHLSAVVLAVLRLQALQLFRSGRPHPDRVRLPTGANGDERVQWSCTVVAQVQHVHPVDGADTVAVESLRLFAVVTDHDHPACHQPVASTSARLLAGAENIGLPHRDTFRALTSAVMPRYFSVIEMVLWCSIACTLRIA